MVMLRRARLDDAPVLARFVDWAGEGMPRLAWADMATPGQTIWEVGASRAAREDGDFSYRNAWVLDEGGPVAGLIGYPILAPTPIGPDFPAAFAPLQELENQVPGFWYVNVLAVLPERRGQGLGTRLLAVAAEQAAGTRGLAIITFAANPGALRLYRREGFQEVSRRSFALPGWDHSPTEAILLTRPL